MEKEERLLYRAKLDADGVYFGVEYVRELADGDVPVDADCDLAPGKYKWNADANRFEPLPRGQQKSSPGAVTAERALFDLISATPNAPASCLAWADNYKKTFDGSDQA